MEWNDFLKRKCLDKAVLIERQRKIEEWIRQCGGIRTLPEDTLRLLENECKRVTDEYDAACRNIRNN